MDQIDDLIEQTQLCKDCLVCYDSCDTYRVSENELLSPNGRLKISQKVFKNGGITDEEIKALYTCTLCAACELVCPSEIKIANLIHMAKARLVEKGKAPLDIHLKITDGILNKDNSVGGDPKERLDWLTPEHRATELFEEKETENLLFFGCMSSFRVKESALAPYLILKHANYDFKIIKQEPCCGEYIYSSGDIELAKRLFKQNIKKFKEIGIKNIIVTCGGCLYAFDKVYRKYFDDFDFQVYHVIDIINKLVKEGKLKLYPLNQSISYHDACRLGRKSNKPLYQEARELLKNCGIDIKDITEDYKAGPCCGAGSGIRGVDSNLSIEIGVESLNKAVNHELSSGCPLCIFNFRYAGYKKELKIKARYLTDYVLEALDKK